MLIKYVLCVKLYAGAGAVAMRDMTPVIKMLKDSETHKRIIS